MSEAPSFTCPRCGRTSFNPKDIEQGYCGACHDWTRVRTIVVSHDDEDHRSTVRQPES